MIEPGALGLLIALGILSALDGTSVGQFMISRPLVTGTLAGWIIGDAATGLLVGALLEAVHLGALPAGGARLPEPGPASIPAAVAAVHLAGAGGLAIAVGAGVLLSALGGGSMIVLRRVNGIVTRGVDAGAVTPRGVVLRHWGCIALDGFRGAVLTGAGMAAVLALPASLALRWPLPLSSTIALLLVPGLLSGGALLHSWSSSRRRTALFLLGVVGGGVLVSL